MSESRAAGYDPSPAMQWLLATLSIGAGAIHLVMVPQHAQESLRVGLAFAAAGWFQLAFGVALLARPKVLWVRLAVGVNLAFIATWAVSRTVGLPSWTGDAGVEDASSVDLLCVALEAGVVLGAVALLVRPDLLRNWKRPALLAASIVPVGILLATTAVLASPEAANHVHGEEGHELATGDGHDHDHSTDGHSSDATAGHDHAESDLTYDQLPPDTKAEVDAVIAVWGDRYATAADATADGWMKATRSLYGIGAHYVRQSGFDVTGEFDLLQPNILLFDGEGPDARFAGLSYVVAAEPEGFAGNADFWHAHASVCLAGGSVVSLSEEDSPVWLSESDCTARGGRVLPLGADQMMHLWIGPGYIDHGPIFAHDHPLLLDGFNPQQDL